MMKISLLPNILTLFMIMILFLIALNNLHPIFLVILLMLYTLMTCLLMSLWSINYMYSIMLFLIMISGLLIIFLYFSSLISNEQNKIYLNYPLLLSLSINLMIFSPLYINKMNLNIQPLNLHSPYEPLKNYSNPLFSNVTKIFIYPNNNLTLISMFYLLIALFIIIKICSQKATSLRKIS